MATSSHARTRAQQRCIPPLIDEWLDRFGSEQFDGRGGVVKYFSRTSIRVMERSLGRSPVRKMAEFLHAYKVESSHDGTTITYGHRTKRIYRP